MLGLIVCLLGFGSSPEFIKDSTLFYELKPNEVMVKRTEHQFLHTSYGDVYVFATYTKNVGHFVRTSNGKSFGPFTAVDDRHAPSGYWGVNRGLRYSVLHMSHGKEYGPFNLDNDSSYYYDPDDEYTRGGFFFYADIVRTKPTFFVNVNGKLYDTRIRRNKDSVAVYQDGFKTTGEDLYVRYNYYFKDYRPSGADSVFITKLVSQPEAPEEIPNFIYVKPKRITSTRDSLFVDDKFYAIADKVLTNAYSEFSEGFVSYQGHVFHTELAADSMVFFHDRKRAFAVAKGDDEGYASFWGDIIHISYNDQVLKYLPVSHKVIKPLFDGELVLPADQSSFGEIAGSEIYINGIRTGYGYGLTYDEKAKAYKWISVHGRKLYMNTYAPK